MTTYDPAEVERLVREARRIVVRLEHGHGIKHVTHDSVPTMRAMSDQLEAARARIAELEAKLVDLQGRKLGNADAWAEAASEATGMYDHMRKLHEALKATIRSLLDTELPAGELRKAVGALVK